jgi:Ca2+-binding RTX toxin-like protein
MINLYANVFRAQYFGPPGGSGGPPGTEDYYEGIWYSTTALTGLFTFITPADEGGDWHISRAGQPANRSYPDHYLNRVEIYTYYDSESNATVVPYNYALYGYSYGTSVKNAYDYVILGGTAVEIFGMGYYEADPAGVTRSGTSGNDVLEGGLGPDVLYGFAGNDSLWGYAGNDSLVGGIDNDILVGGDGNDILYGEEGGDTLVGDAGNDSLAGGSGVDLMYGGAGNDTLTAGADELTNNYLNGGDGNDNMIGDRADDVMEGGAGDDALHGGSGNNSLWGGPGNDVITAYHTPGPGNSFAVTNTLVGGEGNDRITGGVGNDLLVGDEGDDELDGGASNGIDVLFGRAGNDRLNGQQGADWLEGGDGDDTFNDWEGNNTIIGGAGNDLILSFVGTIGGGMDSYLYYGPGFGDDTISGFDPGFLMVNSTDRLVFATSIFANEAAVRAAATYDGTDTIIVSGTDSITLVRTDIDDMTSVNFGFF